MYVIKIKRITSALIQKNRVNQFREWSVINRKYFFGKKGLAFDE